MLTFDGKGIVHAAGALRPATARAADRGAGQARRPGCRPARRTAASGWPSWPAFTTPAPSRRTGGRHQHPRAEAEEEEAQAGKPKRSRSRASRRPEESG